MLLSFAIACLLLAPVHAQDVDRFTDRTDLWERSEVDVLWGFGNMYNPHVIAVHMDLRDLGPVRLLPDRDHLRGLEMDQRRLPDRLLRRRFSRGHHDVHETF